MGSSGSGAARFCASLSSSSLSSLWSSVCRRWIGCRHVFYLDWRLKSDRPCFPSSWPHRTRASSDSDSNNTNNSNCRFAKNISGSSTRSRRIETRRSPQHILDKRLRQGVSQLGDVTIIKLIQRTNLCVKQERTTRSPTTPGQQRLAPGSTTMPPQVARHLGRQPSLALSTRPCRLRKTISKWRRPWRSRLTPRRTTTNNFERSSRTRR